MIKDGQIIQDGTVTWKVRKVNSGGDVPGTVKMFAGDTIPDGYLLCDGSAVSRADYADLFAAIGTLYGEGNGSTTFQLPNYISRFLEGDYSAGTFHSAGVPNITGALGFPTTEASNYGTGAFQASVSSAGRAAGSGGNKVCWSFDASRVSTIYGASATVQPPAVTILFIIKY